MIHLRLRYCPHCEGSGWTEIADARHPGQTFARPCSCPAGLGRAQSEAWLGRAREALPNLGQGEVPADAEGPF